MKKLLLILLCVPLLLIYCLLFNCGLENKKIEIEDKNDLQNHNLKSKVKYVASSCYEAIESFGMIEKGDKLDNDYLTEDTIRYNPKGYIQEEVIYGNNYTEYKYDEQGLLKETISFSKVFLNKKELSGTGTYKYNNKKQLIEISTIYWSFLFDTAIGISSYEYNELGQMSTYKSGDYQYKYKYDTKGNKIEDITYTNEVITARRKYTYDINNNMINKLTYEKSGESRLTRYEYDNQENVTKKSTSFKIITDDFNWTNEDGSEFEPDEQEYDMKIEITYKYKYDENMNWISKVQYMNGKPQIITERTIKYYK